jgi:hypothetical protein
MVGIGLTTLDNWLDIPEFFERVEGAIASRKLIRLKRIENGDVGWQACCWLMERTDPIKWARPEVSLMIQNNNAGVLAGPSEAALLKGLNDYNALKNGQRKATEEAPREV